MKKFLFLSFLIAYLIIVTALQHVDGQAKRVETNDAVLAADTTPTPTPLPKAKTLTNAYWVSQSFNNCGPASLSMALSYYGVTVSQEELGQALRPYANPQGDNDDKSVTMDEMAEKAQEYHLVAYHRANGDITLLKRFIANNLPVITQTWLEKTDDIGHYRIVKGYDDAAQTLIQDDSYQGHDLVYSYDDFNELWGKYNYEYLVLVPENKKDVAEEILGQNKDEKASWQSAAKRSQALLKQNPEDTDAWFNLSVANYRIGDYKGAIAAYEKVANKLPSRTLWYQIEPIEAYYKMGNYDQVMAISQAILDNNNRAFSELYLLRGNIYKQQGNIEKAKAEYEKALFYNQNLKSAQTALASVS